MTDPDPDDLERLASRIALLVSETGEADNAGRAVGALARKLGLSGGDLKQIFLDGHSGDRRVDARTDASREGLEHQNAELRARIGAADTAMRAVVRERDALRLENRTIRSALDRGRTSEQVTRILGAIILAASLAGTMLFFFGPSFRPQSAELGPPASTPFARAAQVRTTGASAREMPDASSTAIARIPPGTVVPVKRLVWNALLQWAEIEIDGRRGFVATTELNLL